MAHEDADQISTKGPTLGFRIFASLEVTAISAFIAMLISRGMKVFDLPSFQDILQLKSSVFPGIAVGAGLAPMLSLSYIKSSATCALPCSPVNPKSDIVEGTSDVYNLAMIHLGHQIFCFTPLATAALAMTKLDMIRSRVRGPAELVPFIYFFQTWGYYHALVEHDVKGWQFEADEKDKDTVLFSRTLNGMFIGLTAAYGCLATATLGQGAWLCAAVPIGMNMYRPSWTNYMGFNMMGNMAVTLAGLVGSRRLYNGYGGWFVFFLASSTNPGISKLMKSGDQRWHLLEAWQATLMTVFQHLVVIRAFK